MGCVILHVKPYLGGCKSVFTRRVIVDAARAKSSTIASKIELVGDRHFVGCLLTLGSSSLTLSSLRSLTLSSEMDLLLSKRFDTNSQHISVSDICEAMYKSQLQEYTQKLSWSLPIYDSVKEGTSHEPKFKATVVVNGSSYESDPGFSNLKAAEHAAAKRALDAILKTENVPVGQSQLQSGLCKNILQEYAQKHGFPLPIYSSTKSGEDHSPMFITTVELNGKFYSGDASKNKKDAEIRAARATLIAIQSSELEGVVPARVTTPAASMEEKQVLPEEKIVVQDKSNVEIKVEIKESLNRPFKKRKATPSETPTSKKYEAEQGEGSMIIAM